MCDYFYGGTFAWNHYFFICIYGVKYKHLNGVFLHQKILQNKPIVLVTPRIKIQGFEEVGRTYRSGTFYAIADIFMWISWIEKSNHKVCKNTFESPCITASYIGQIHISVNANNMSHIPILTGHGGTVVPHVTILDPNLLYIYINSIYDA